ncbi:unnamed protein product [Paramecium sonneborni]|uniref:Uncharacterized protein n=1 Tax=Paramecium sonneborni TaxID=65129 RepID=A0A8S1PMZ1_9CILI|nr:unnamed protein product [Paramecium sonneborni]
MMFEYQLALQYDRFLKSNRIYQTQNLDLIIIVLAFQKLNKTKFRTRIEQFFVNQIFQIDILDIEVFQQIKSIQKHQ